MPSLAALKLAPWSTSKVQCALRCPLEFHLRYVERLHETEVAPDTRLGKAVHGALESVLRRTPVAEALAAGRLNLLHDEERTRFDELAVSIVSFGERIDAFRARRRVTRELIEYRLAVAFDLSPTEFVAPNAFFRGVWDVAFLFDDGVLAVVDHKSGVRRPGADYADQLGGYATLAAAHLPHVRKVWLGVHFVAQAALEWSPPIDLAHIRAEVMPRLVATIEEAAQAVRERTANLSTWCRRCSYRQICPALRGAPVELPEAPAELLDDRVVQAE